MIVSHEHKFIFLKTKKTAGTSLEIVLSLYAGHDDVITRLDRDDEEMRNMLGGVGPQNYWPLTDVFSPKKLGMWWQGINYRIRTGRHDRTFLPVEPFRQHMEALVVRRKVGEQVWQRYYKFAVERNPWDRVVSNYYWKAHRQNPVPSFREFVLSGMAMTRPRNYDIYSIDGLPAVDRVIDYAGLKNGVRDVFEQIGLPKNAEENLDDLKAKGTYRPDRDYRNMYDEDTRNVVAQQFAQEIWLMGYDF